MAKQSKGATITSTHELVPLQTVCPKCAGPFWIAYHTNRRVTTLLGMCYLSIKVRRCQNADCSFYHRPYRPEEEGHWALPHGEFGLDVIALIGSLQ